MRVALLMMQRNESELLGPWLAYHGSLFGYASLFLFDNGSDRPEVLGLLDRARLAGAHVAYLAGDPRVYEDSAEILGQRIRELDAQEPRDFYFPMDCDEFLVLRPRFSRQPRFDADSILRYLERLRGERRPLKICGAYWNTPLSEDHYYFARWRKLFFCRKTFSSMTKGAHRARTVCGLTRPLKTRIAYVHLHNRPFSQLRQAAQAKMRGRVSSFEPRDLIGYVGRGNHLVRYFLCDEQAYVEQFRDRRMIRVERFRRILEAHQSRHPFSGTCFS